MAEQRISDERAQTIAMSPRSARRGEIASLARDLLAARELLRKIEWSGPAKLESKQGVCEWRDSCPSCAEFRYPGDKHHPDCRLAALIGSG